MPSLERTQSRTALRALEVRLFQILSPPPRIKVSEWANTYRYLTHRKKFSTAFAPYQTEPMDSACDESVISTTLVFASQLGKTEVLNNIIGFHIHSDPCPILMVQPTVKPMAEAWSKERFAPMIECTPCLKELIAGPRARDSGNTMLSKFFPGGDIAIAGANSPSGLAARPRRVVIEDEIDRYPESAGTEGDPCALAEKRTESFWNAVIFRASTPTKTGMSRIWAEWEQTDKRYCFCPCPKCGHFQILKWSMVKWEPGRPDTAWMECQNEKCGARLTDADRMAMIFKGEWRATAEFKGHRGYHLNGLYSPFKRKKGYRSRLHEFAAKFIEAKAKGEKTLQAWTNTFLAETYGGDTESVEPAPLLARCEAYGPTLPAGVLFLTGGGDVHADRIEAEIVGWGLGEESWGIARGAFLGSPHSAKVWEALDTFFLQEFTHPRFGQMKAQAIAVDCGYASKDTHAYIKRCQPRFAWAVKGAKTRLREPVERTKRKRIWFALVDTPEFKTMIYNRLKMESPGPRYMHFPKSADYDEEFFAQLTAERVRTTYKKGFPTQEWENVRSNRRNEALDIRVYNGAALYLRRVNFPELLKTLAKGREPVKGEEVAGTDAPTPSTPGVKPTKRPRRPHSSWLNRWRK